MLPKTFNFTALKHAEQLRLKVQREFGDLIQEQRSLVRKFQPAGLLVGGAIKCSFLISEQFAFLPGAGYPTMNFHEALVPSSTHAVDGSCDRLFPRSGFAGNQRRGIA